MFKKKKKTTLQKPVEDKRITIHYIGGEIGKPEAGQVFGGTMATNYIIKRAFENSKKYKLVMKPRSAFSTIQEVKDFLDKGDIAHLDETSLLQQFYQNRLTRPDVIGPISRSPVKNYNNGEWGSVYTPEYFYSGIVMRLNENEEKEVSLKPEFKKAGDEFVKKVNFIRHGIDTELLQPVDCDKKYILWAANAARPAKNYPMWQDIKNYIVSMGGLPDGFEFRQMSGFAVDRFWEVLNSTAIYVCTSQYESFCNANNEARAKGVPTIVRDHLTGTYMYTDQPIQVPYDAAEYGKKIIELCNNLNSLKVEQKKARKWVEDNCSLDVMREDMEKVYDLAYKQKYGTKRKTTKSS